MVGEVGIGGVGGVLVEGERYRKEKKQLPNVTKY